MDRNQSRRRQLSVSITGSLLFVLVVGPACAPQQLRAAAATRIVGVVKHLNNALTHAWQAAFVPRVSTDRAAVSAGHSGSGSHSVAPSVTTGDQASPSAVIGGATLASFDAAYSHGPKWNSVPSLLGDVSKTESVGSGGGSGAFAGGGNDSGSVGAGARSGGGGAFGEGEAMAALSNSSSAEGGRPDSVEQNSEGSLHRLTAVKTDTHQDPAMDAGNSFISVSGGAGASLEVVSTQSLNILAGESVGDTSKPNPNGGSHNSTDVAVVTTTNNLSGESSGEEPPPHPSEVFPGDPYQNEVPSSGSSSNSGSAPPPIADSMGSGPVVKGISSPPSGTLPGGNVAAPESGSLVLLGTCLLVTAFFVRRKIAPKITS